LVRSKSSKTQIRGKKMKKHLLAIAALAAISGSVAAQNVTVYGVIDNAFQTQSKSGTNGTAGRITSMQRGGLVAPVWGFTGSEDLGGGLKASFDLQGYVDTDTGVGNQFGGVFGRASWVALTSSAGTVKFGKQLDPAILAFYTTDPRSIKETQSGLITWYTGADARQLATADTDTTVNHNQIANIFLANAVSYSNSFNGLNVGIGYSFGEKAGDQKANSVASLGVSYTASGVTVSGTYSKNEGANSADTGKSQSERSSFGLGYQVTPTVKVKANYMKAELNSNLAVLYTDNEVYGYGVEYQWNPKNLFTVAYYDGENKTVANDTSKSIIVSNEYSLSKRTTLYALASSHKGGSGYTRAASMGTTSANTTTVVTQLGIAHRF
jgi:predicted porin